MKKTSVKLNEPSRYGSSAIRSEQAKEVRAYESNRDKGMNKRQAMTEALGGAKKIQVR